VPLAYVLAHFTATAEYPHGHPFSLSISLLTAWTVGMIVSLGAFYLGKTQKMIRREMAERNQTA
jgi:hypothetical protein